MGKLVVLKLDGDFEQQGFRVTLEIGLEGERPNIEIEGQLPPAPELVTHLNQWQQNYRSLGLTTRIKPEEIIYGGSINHCRQSAHQLQECFGAWLKSGPFREIDTRLREELTRFEPIRVLIRTQDSQLRKLPWHLWDFFERYPLAELALSAKQFERPPQQPPQVTRKEKVKILAILGHSANINIDADRQLLENLPNAQTVFLVEPQHEEINDQLWEQSWDIIFFAGHSKTEKETGRIYINPTESLTVNELWYALKKALKNGLKLAIFNSCDGLGLARQLDDLQIPQMIIMRDLVPDFVAQEFLKHFLGAFAGGKSLYLAAREARERLQGLESNFPCASWLPVICQNLAEVPPTWKDLSVEDKPGNKSLKIVFQFKITIALGCISSILFFCLFLPKLAVFVNDLGLKSHKEGQLLMAQRYYHLAALLNPNYAQPRYNLGWLCDENLNDTNCAIQAYQDAALRGLPEASAELARLQILQENYSAAQKSIEHCLKWTEYDAVKAACLKSRSWILLEENLLPQAEKDLRDAITLRQDSPHAQCLLAQVLKKQGRQQEALKVWNNTKDSLKYNVPEQHECIKWANQRSQALRNQR